MRAAGAIDLPTIQRYLNFHFSVTIDLFGADQSSNAATFYSARTERAASTKAKRADDHRLQDAHYRSPGSAVDGRLVERDAPMLNALNEVLRDDYIKDSVGGIGRWNKVMEKAGIDRCASCLPHKAFNRKIGTLATTRVFAGRPRHR